MYESWSDADVGLAIRVLSRSENVRAACNELQRILGLNISERKLRKIFEAKEIGSPGSFVEGEKKDRIPERLDRIILLPDVHVPFHDLDAWNLVLRAIRAFRPNRLVILGDFLDCYSVSSHSKNPERRACLQPELDAGNSALDELDAAAGVDCLKHFCMGNHEYRIERYIADNAPALSGLVDMQRYLRLDERCWRVTPYKTSLQVGKLRITHDFGSAGGKAHEDARHTAEGNAVIGHTHRMSVTYRGNVFGELHVGAMFGWLGRFEDIDYRHVDKARREWSHGFGMGWIEPNGNVHLQAVPIIQTRCVVNGELITL